MSKQETRGPETVAGQAHTFEPPFGEVGQGVEELQAAGKVGEAVSQGMYLALLSLMGGLRARRESMGLSLSDVAERTGMTRQSVSKLENGLNTNPTMQSIWRYAGALGAEVNFAIGEAEAWDE
ncbi:helix-turn-helix domain-containing protein (plasmid) [Tundrisphaera lichenicola]|uniref:helix-turn-helix domain-containing protein n=1 Tax=Tundrisphaera lichenicola TaxID=2029860 RepID=UPI003EC04CBD